MSRPCPHQAAHTPAPSAYLDWHDWARRMEKTHRQVMCNGCGRYLIWRPKSKCARCGKLHVNEQLHQRRCKAVTP